VVQWLGCFLRWLALSTAATLLVLWATTGIFVVLVLTAPSLTGEWGTAGGLSLFALCLPIAFVVAVAAHEAGHVLAGACVGMRLQFAHVGPVTCTRRRADWSISWDWLQPWLGGRAVCALRARGRWRVAIFLLGGPLANLASGMAAATFAAGGIPALPRCCVGLFAVFSLFLGTANLLPLRERRFNSDGLALLNLFATNQANLQ